ncbi:tRNA A37 N6-isopentenylltransferase MiaA (MiaA) [Fructobacillus fructosus]|uniref:tRNA (adenosine(37)-N6)-dimethylallyltransferase MiaA n=1 Tax=Fructobacillus fructosus TaxID=1631 RepID=UPI00021954E2|nr:tRNA (adenosine(37)-N6)-dimethylallyltransferase MiaA [Fructobacillus fructosus]KRN53419.1 tRNA delta(2)-isopentenylpyrophosphate transferase [Fructobacillus fructosus KCTC 3544]CAK1223570.1 tRNA A37 N6-isopentenylltransferase MiaA (MiaA) [Fructobacillus fructosus]CAK1229039.1 tRNA A37 N6-isopentenylltransferase MiaA (MiaA) [Fructobacillus fructosus]CAK1235623.1 tRNA A37 N6-isopentenylltransferase MiaA (MiaA) [Fructobacillus fructosus]CAK1237202.1 tRNA A37 N6-isopentenylltransferase MiaA (M
MNKIKIIVIAGPTASGKSELAMDLAEKFNGELVSADSLQVYQQLDIGTAKATSEELQRVPQYLIDLVPYTANFSVIDFVSAADDAIQKIVKKGRLPIIVGGTGFYVKALLGQQSFDYAESDSDEVARAMQRPLEELVDELKKTANSEILQRTDLNNKTRVVRALQITKHGQKKMESTRPAYDSLVLAIEWPRELLYERINTRVHRMVEKGLEDEARLLFDSGGLNLQAGRGIGYKEFYPYFAGQGSLKEVISAIQQDSRRYAKRQLTYWRHQIDGLQWIDWQNRQQSAETKVADFIKKE